MKNLPKLVIGDLEVDLPIVQGGMGIGISLSRLAGAVAGEGGIGIISTAQIGFLEKDFKSNPFEANIRAIGLQLKKAREIFEANKKRIGAIGFNIMVATKGYADYVKTAVKEGADIIISGAGLPLDLPKYVEEGMKARAIDKANRKKTKIAPVVSSAKAADVILRMWDRKYKLTADMIVIEGPLAGGHLGFSLDNLNEYGAKENYDYTEYDKSKYDLEIQSIKKIVDGYGEKYAKKIPIVFGGGVYDHKDVEHVFNQGLDGVVVGTRFVTTQECDAPEEYKQAYINSQKEDIIITKSPVGLPGRAIKNKFIEYISGQKKKVTSCYKCLTKCDVVGIPYCITEALIAAATADIDNALLFCGANAYRSNRIETVEEVINDLIGNNI